MSETLSPENSGVNGGLDALVAEASANAGAGEEAVTPVNAQKNRPLYESRQKVYPKLVHGNFRKLKWLVMALTLGVYYTLPWIRWERAPGLPDQAVLLDFPARRFYFFFLEIWPQEFYYITGLLILAALGLFLITSVAGRVWCGYTCPQTVWTDLFIHIERFWEGDRSARIRRDKQKFKPANLARKLGKHLSWVLVAIATGGAFVFYFDDAPTLAQQFLQFDAAPIAYIFVALFASTTYLLGGLAREQVCIYMCPWPRIQGAMFDEESLMVSYEVDRGEPRGPHKKGASWEGRGDCIDCGQCVAACPMGIDIRDGMQLECIQCALCIDACDEIMDRVERPRGLIGYDTIQNMERRKNGEKPRFRIIRPRTILYTAVWMLVAVIMLVALLNRDTQTISVLADRNPLFVQLSDGSIRNGFEVKIINKEHKPQTFDVSLDGLEGAVLLRGGATDADDTEVDVAPDDLASAKFFVALPSDRLDQLKSGEAAFTFKATNMETGEVSAKEVNFKGPEK